MNQQIAPVQWKRFMGRVVVPTILTIVLFVSAFFVFIIPTIERNSLDRKREMIRELTNSAWNILAKFEYDEQQGLLSREEAQRLAVEQIRNLHYGQQMKDYFWINDMHPRMVIHPYRTDLNGSDLSDYTDPNGKRVFVEMVDVVRRNGSGYVQYMWQWKDDESRIVPKISYVKGFSPWGWIIGTGIYIEDVKAEVGAITQNLISISLVILLIISLLLITIIMQHYRTEKQRSLAEQALRDSEEKYRTFVESAAEGMLMALGGSYIYSNQTIAKLLGYNQAEFGRLQLFEIFADNPQHPGAGCVHDLLAGKKVPERFEAQLRTKAGEVREVIVSTSEIFVDGKTGFIAVITDITTRKRAEEALGASEEKFRTLANNLNVGVFRLDADDPPHIVEANPALVTIFGCESREQLLGCALKELLADPAELQRIIQAAAKTPIEHEIIACRKKDGSRFTASIWACAVRDDEGSIICYDGIVEDATARVTREKQRDQLFEEMQTSMFFLNQPLDSLPLERPQTCPAQTSLADALTLLQTAGEAVLVVDADQRPCGVLSDAALRRHLTAQPGDLSVAVAEVMQRPPIMLPASSCVFEAGFEMRKHKVSLLFATDQQQQPCGIVTSDMLLPLHRYSPIVLLRAIQQAQTPEAIIEQKGVLPYLVTTLVASGAKPQYITHLTTVVADTLLQKLIEFAIQELGLPPVRFSFLIFGSEGRQEQTLRTDQDNALVYEDVPEVMEPDVHAYFHQLSTMVCGWLDRAGYPYCDGDNMAQNETWCQPMTVWKKYFSTWMSSGTAEDLLQTKIFFDFRSAYGDRDLAAELRRHLHDMVSQNPRFFQLLARNVLQITPPIGFFGSFVVESVGEHGKVFDIKSAMMPIVDYARIYALQQKIEATNTLERLRLLYEGGTLSHQNYHEMVQAYTYLMQIRLRSQSETITAGSKEPDNYIRPQDLSFIEQKLLKEIFSQTKNFQAHLSYDFTGRAEGV